MNRFVVLLTALAALTSGAAAPPPPAPAPAAADAPTPAETPASGQVRRLISAAAATDDAGFRGLLKEIYPKADLTASEWTDMRGHLAALQVHGLSTATATHAELFVFNTELDHWMKAVIDVEPTAPYAITAFGLRMSPRPPDVSAPPRLQPAQLSAALRDLIKPQVADGRFAGVVLVTQQGRTLFSGAYGLADEATGAANTLETRFRFGSVGKLFTTVAIMQLAQAGKLDLNAPIGRYLTDYPNADIAARVTINQLLTHSGGTGDIFGPGFDAHRDSLRNPQDYVALYGARPPLFEPGSRQDYSNYGFVLLGRIVEVVSGLGFDEYLQRNIFGPAGMTAAGMEPEDATVPNRATAYMRMDGRLQAVTAQALAALGPRNSGFMEYRGGPAGGGYATVGDFQRFAEALTSNRLMDAEHLKLLTEGRVTLPTGRQVSYDFGGPTEDGRRFVGHGGGGAGQSAEFRIYPGGYVVVVLLNRDPPAATRVVTFVGDRLP